MNLKTKLFTGAVALTLAATTVLTASGASARPYDYDRYNGRDNGAAWWKQDRDDDYNDRDYRRDLNRDRRFNRRNVYIYSPSRRRSYYGNSIVRLPEGCRRVVYRDRVYYTRDNDTYYSYDTGRRGFIVVNFPGLRIGF
jgi:hypothetical protein